MTKKTDAKPIPIPTDKHLTRRQLIKWGVGAGAAVTLGGVPFVSSVSRAQERTVKGLERDDSLPQVPRRVLGKTGQTIPILLVGGGVPFDAKFDPKLAEAYRFGVDYIDAADCYSNGQCEPAVGSFVNTAGIRKKIWITSKSDQHDPKGFEQTLLTGLERFGTDYFDMYFLHALKDPKEINDDLKATVARLKKEGKFRFFGFSCHDGNVDELLTVAARTPWVDTVMFRYNFAQYGKTELNKAMDACAASGVGLIAMKTQRSEVSFKDAWKKFETKGKWNKYQAVLKAVWEDERISAAVSHMDTFEKLKQNIAAAVDKTDLGAAEREALGRYAAATRDQACDGCDHICGAAVDAPVEIGSTLRYLMYHDIYGEPDKARALYARLPEPARRLDGVDFSAASRACPLGVDVAAHMARAREALES